MQIKEINENEFDNFANNHILKNYYQTSKYGNLMKKFGYNPIYIAMFEENKIIGKLNEKIWIQPNIYCNV